MSGGAAFSRMTLLWLAAPHCNPLMNGLLLGTNGYIRFCGSLLWSLPGLDGSLMVKLLELLVKKRPNKTCPASWANR
ncbi:hypothetical protein D3C86_2154720 [compost metagenome]